MIDEKLDQYYNPRKEKKADRKTNICDEYDLNRN
jgi:hypothetical protein